MDWRGRKTSVLIGVAYVIIVAGMSLLGFYSLHVSRRTSQVTRQSLRASTGAIADKIVRKGPLTGVFVAKGSGTDRMTAGLRWITLGRTRDGSVEVLTGLVAGERYVVEPTSQLRDGQPIEVR